MKARRRFLWRSAELVVEARDARHVSVRFSEGETVADSARLPDGRRSIILPSGRQLTGRAVSDPGGRVEAWVSGRRLAIPLSDPLRALAAAGKPAFGGAAEIRAQIPGRVVEVRVSAGDLVSPGATLVVLEAMKMQNEIQAEADARVVAVLCGAGQTVDTGAILVRLEPRPSE